MERQDGHYAHRPKTWAEIDLGALVSNYRYLKSLTKSRIAAVVKADAYGHGAARCAQALAAEGADTFAVSCTDEAVSLRLALSAYTSPKPEILILGYTAPEDTELLFRYGITQTVFSAPYAASLAAAVESAKRRGTVDKDARLPVHIKLDTGMNRIGFDAEDPAACAEEILASIAKEHLAVTGVFTHFACADEPETDMTARQFEAYRAVTDRLAALGAEIGTRHVCNSAALLAYPEYHLDMVRAGIVLYGLSPDGTPVPGLRPVMKLCTTVSHVHTVRPGGAVSYGASFTADRPLTAATLPIGYADGFIRDFQNGGSAMIGTVRAPVIGRVCMDQCMVDVTGADVRPGDTAVLFGDEPGSLEALARTANTINYELVCLVGKRVVRVYRDGEEDA